MITQSTFKTDDVVTRAGAVSPGSLEIGSVISVYLGTVQVKWYKGERENLHQSRLQHYHCGPAVDADDLQEVADLGSTLGLATDSAGTDFAAKLAMFDVVNKAEHYNVHPSGVECIDIIRHHDLDTGAAMKYLWRCGLKPDAGLSVRAKEIQDLEKAAYYINDRITHLKGLK